MQHRCFATRRFWLTSPLPPLLTIQLKRFKRRGARFEKSNDNVVLPEKLDLRDFMITTSHHKAMAPHLTGESEKTEPQKPDESACCYELYGICAHQGSTLESGHYIAYVNTGPSLDREKWYGTSDTKVWSCSRAEALKADSYVVFYRREGLVQIKEDDEDDNCDKGSSNNDEEEKKEE